MSGTYYVYNHTGFSASGSTLTSVTLQKSALGSGKLTSAATGSITDNGGSVNLLGDVAGDTFTIGTTTYTYQGLATFTLTTNSAGTTTQQVSGFVASYATSSGTAYSFITTTGPSLTNFKAATTGTPGNTLTPDSPGTSSTYWNLSTNTANCFCQGTLIATPAGAVPVETLAAGDLVLTADGRAMPVRWLGRSAVSRFGSDPSRILPVRIKAGALDENVPARDLLVSPGHAVLAGDVLAHAGALLNGSSIVQERDMPMVFTYYHVELDAHALLLAEGAPAESYLDGVEEIGFDNLDERPGAGAMEEMAYPRVKASRQLPQAVKAHLAARAAALAGPVAAAA